jgi:hypothetical protein
MPVKRHKGPLLHCVKTVKMTIYLYIHFGFYNAGVVPGSVEVLSVAILNLTVEDTV